MSIAFVCFGCILQLITAFANLLLVSRGGGVCLGSISYFFENYSVVDYHIAGFKQFGV